MNTVVVVELIKTIPSILWFIFGLTFLIAFYQPIRYKLIPRIKEIKALGVEAAFVQEELDRAALEQAPIGASQDRIQVARRAERLAPIIKGSNILLVNDNPSEMHYVISILKGLEIQVKISTSTAEANKALADGDYDLIISDVMRDDVPDEGIRFLQDLFQRGVRKPVILTPGNFDPDLGVPAYAFGITNRIDELLNLVFDVLERTRG